MKLVSFLVLAAVLACAHAAPTANEDNKRVVETVEFVEKKVEQRGVPVVSIQVEDKKKVDEAEANRLARETMTLKVVDNKLDEMELNKKVEGTRGVPVKLNVVDHTEVADKKKLEARGGFVSAEDEDDDDDDKKKADMARGISGIKKSVDPHRRDIEEDSVPVNVTEFGGVNPCESTRNFNYYVAFPNDTARYIQCDPWGTGLVRRCVKGLIWSMWELRCDVPENVHNSSFVVPQRVFNCSLSGFECLNGGVCTESSVIGDRCVCKPDFTGPTCETRVDTSDLTHEILNGTFSLERFRARLAALNISSDVAQYERYRDQLDNATFTELMSYMSLYRGSEVRYDTLINQLVETILENIYPDAAYLSSFNSSSVSVVDLVQLIPNLLSYSKYSLERYQDVFAKYQQVLSQLIHRWNGNATRLREEAIRYTRLTGVFMNQTLSLLNQTYSNSGSDVNEMLTQQQQQQHPQYTQLSEAQIKQQLRSQFNSTLNTTLRLFQSLERFQAGVTQLLQSNRPDVYTLTIADSKIEGSAEVQQLLAQISSSSVQIWDSLVNYGFWFITSLLTTPIDQIQRLMRDDVPVSVN